MPMLSSHAGHDRPFRPPPAIIRFDKPRSGDAYVTGLHDICTKFGNSGHRPAPHRYPYMALPQYMEIT